MWDHCPHYCGSYEFPNNDNFISAVFKLREMSAIGWAKYVENIENILQKIGARGWYKYIGIIERTLQGKSAKGWDKYIVNIERTLQEISVRD